LPWASTLRPRARRKNLQAEIRPSRFESPGKEFAHRAGRNHRPKSRLLRRPRLATLQRSRNHPHKPKRPNQRRHAPQIPPTIQRPISPRSQPRPPRFPLPLHPIHRHDAGIPEARELPPMSNTSEVGGRVSSGHGFSRAAITAKEPGFSR